MAWRMTDKTNAQLQAERDRQIKDLLGKIIKNEHDFIGEYGEVIRVERKKSLKDIWEVEYKYLIERVKCTCQFDAAVYEGDISNVSYWRQKRTLG